MSENGPKLERFEELVRQRDHEINTRLSSIETKMSVVAYIAGALLTGIVAFGVLVLVGTINP